MNAFSNCALAFVGEGAVEPLSGEFDLDLDPDFDLLLNGGVGLVERALEEPLFEADLPLLKLGEVDISILWFL